MLIAVFKYSYIIVCALLFLLIVFGKLFVFKKKEAVFVSDYTSSIAMSLAIYVVLSIVGAFLYPVLLKKLLFVGFGLSPFVLGYIAKYETEKYFTLIQLLMLVLSVVYILEI